MREIMVLSMANSELYNCQRPFQVTWSEKKCEEKKKPLAMICTIEFNRFVWNTLALLKPLLKTEKEECLLTLKWIQTLKGQACKNGTNSSK